ncbi:ABC transporter substrate-binding protein [Taklimakanibacter lacteus]|uniref:ABC transporter substrate-binding protein n=1 Tax=Taklimakanibacter lacteus TaxID=2268456 RepID=UPI0034D662AD
MLLWLLATAAGAQTPGVTPGRVLFGQSAALGGPTADLGTEMRRGILAAFEEVNRGGGVDGRRLELRSYDDRYEPELAIANTMKLIKDDDVFALIGAVGTPTSAASEPIARAAGVPFIAPFTGAEFLRDPALANVVNVRASYFQETEAIIDRLISDRGISRIGVLYQDDSYGRGGLAGVRQALDKRHLELVGTGTYMRNTTAVKTALLSLNRLKPEAIIVIGAYQPSATFTQWARKLGVDALIFNLSFVGSDALASVLGEAGDGVYITQVVPFPEADALPLLAQYRKALVANDAAARSSFGSLEGYIAGRLAADVLARAGAQPTRESFLKALVDTGTFDIGGFMLRYGAGDNQGSDQVFLTVIRKGEVVPAERLTP